MRSAFPDGPHRRSSMDGRAVFTAFERQRRPLVPSDRHHRVPGRRRQRRVLPPLPVGRSRRVVDRRGPSPLRGDARLQPGVLRIAGRPLRPHGPRVLRRGRAEDDRLPRDLPDGVLLPRSVQRIALPPALARRVPRGEAGSVGQRGDRRRARGAHPKHRRGPGSGAHRDGARATERPQQPVAAGARRRGGAPGSPHLLRMVGAGTRNRAGADPCTGRLATPRGLSAHDALERRQARGGPRGGGSELLADRRCWSSAW